MNNAGNYSNILKQEGLKNTKHRNAVLDVVTESERPISAEQVFIELKRKCISISLSTVYRILESFASRGVVIKSNFTGESRATYELNRFEHKHYLICSACKKTLPVEGCPLEEYEKRLNAQTNFEITGHRLEIYGLCGECRAAR